MTKDRSVWKACNPTTVRKQRETDRQTDRQTDRLRERHRERESWLLKVGLVGDTNVTKNEIYAVQGMPTRSIKVQ